MNWTTVSSTNISKIGYDEVLSELSVVFNNGRTYTYLGVPRNVYQEFLSASSKGSFVHTRLRNRYPFK